ncbi:hypothetical protein ACPCBC_17110 [Streptomyces incarnatus]
MSGYDYGVELWRVSGPMGEWKLKLGSGPGAARVAREAAVWSRLGPAGLDRSRFQHGDGGGCTWLVTPWHCGPTLWELCTPVRQCAVKARHEVLTGAVDTCITVAAVHLRGWVHGDLQPHHIIFGPSGARLIDWSRAWSADSGLPPAGRGLVHLASPETLADADKPVTAADESWTLAAMLWWAASGRWPRDYRALGIDPAMFTTAELARVLERRPAPLGRIAWPELEQVLRTVLTAPAASRPTAAELALHLAGIPA